MFSWVLFKYLAKLYSLWFLTVLFAFSFIITLCDCIELLRRSKSHSAVDVSTVFKMVCLHLPGILQETMPLVMLFASILMLWRLAQSGQLVALRAAGTSLWQLLCPLFAATGIFVLTDVTILNPLGASMMRRYEVLDAQLFRGEDQTFALFKGGLWVKQPTPQGYALIRISKILKKHQQLWGITIFQFDNDNGFQQRLDAHQADIEPASWKLREVTVSKDSNAFEKLESLDWPTDLNFSSIQDQFLSPSTLSVWEMPQFISMLEDAGLATTRHRVYWHMILSRPLLFISMILLGALCVYKAIQRRAKLSVVTISIILAFFLFIFHSILIAMGNSLTIPAAMATWTPGILGLLLLLALHLHLEDG